jgi:Fis family transcriptional regulator, factor for inversion stimulation protein
MGRGGPGSVRKTLRINTGNEIGKTVEKSLDEYFRRLDGESPHGIYDMVINHVERALIASVMDRTGGNQTQAADMLGMNRNTLRSKLAKYDIR